MGCCACIDADEIGLLERQLNGDSLPPNRAFAEKGQIGYQLDYAEPGCLCIKWPFETLTMKAKFTVIDHNHLGIVTAMDGSPLPPGRILAPDAAGPHHNSFQNPTGFINNNGVRGEQLRFLTNGTYKIHPLVFKVRMISTTIIGGGRIGIVHARDGVELPCGSLVGRRVSGHENFQKAEMFLVNGGQKGPQVDVLRPGTYNIHTGMFQVEVKPMTSIPDGHIGLVEALGGLSMPRTDVVCDTPAGHSNFEDAEGFLQAGGGRGPQTAILPPGDYYINPLLFRVRVEAMTVVTQGQVAVLISNHGRDASDLVFEGTAIGVPAISVPGGNENDGDAPAAAASRVGSTMPASHGETGGHDGPKAPLPGSHSDDEHIEHRHYFIKDDEKRPGAPRHVVPAGFRGIQRDVLGPGRYNINTMVNQIVLFPTITRSLEWARHGSHGGAGIFDPFEVVSNDGFPMKIEVRCQYRVLPENAPYVIQKLGSIEELERNVIDPQIDGIFRAEVSKSPAISYQQKRAEEQQKAEAGVRADLAKYRVEVVSVMITNIHLPQQLMETTQKKNLAEVQRTMFDEQEKTEKRRIEFARTQALANNQPSIVDAEAGILIAQHKAEAEVKSAEGKAREISAVANAEANRTMAVGSAEANVIELKGRATAEAYRLGGAALTPAGLTAVEVMKSVAGAGLRITPDVTVVGGGKAAGGDSTGGMLSALLGDLLWKRTPRVFPDDIQANPDIPRAAVEAPRQRLAAAPAQRTSTPALPPAARDTADRSD